MSPEEYGLAKMKLEEAGYVVIQASRGGDKIYVVAGHDHFPLQAREAEFHERPGSPGSA